MACNLCGRDDTLPVAERDKFRLPLTTVMCRGCGLLYLDPRPTAATYRRFYEKGGIAPFAISCGWCEFDPPVFPGADATSAGGAAEDADPRSSGMSRRCAVAALFR